MARRPKDLSEALLPMAILYAIIGHSIFQYPIGRPRVLFSCVYSLITSFLYYSSVTYNVIFVRKPQWNTTQQALMSILLWVNIAIATLTQIITWYHARTFSRIVKKLLNVDETLQKLGAKMNYNGTMIVGILVIIYWLITLIVLNTFDAVLMPQGIPHIPGIWYIMTLNHGVHINAIVSLNFALALRILDSRYHKLNELIENSFDSYYRQTRGNYTWALWRYKNSIMDSSSRLFSRRILQADDNYKSLIQIIKHVHLELMVISRYVDKIYGLPIALETACFFISSTGLMYDLIKVATKSIVYNREIEILSTIAWIAVPFANFMFINRSCERIRATAKRTGSLIHGIDDSSGDFALRDEIKQFSFQLMKSPVCFSPCTLFDLGYPFVIKVVHSVVTYLVIIIQSESDN